MSWIEKLYRTYELVPVSQIGVPDDDGKNALMPICHTTNKAQIEIVIDDNGVFRSASVVASDDATTLIPCTEDSGGRAGSKPINHPLADKLQYVARDFLDFGGTVTSGFAKAPREPHDSYVADLEAWCSSEHGHEKARTILKYVLAGTVVADLVQSKILFLDEGGQLVRDWNEPSGDPPPIFKVFQGEATPEDAFVRWRVQSPDVADDTTWADPTLWQSWERYYVSKKEREGLCFVEGHLAKLAEQHPSKIRNAGDKAKLISSNDNSGFTFRGRFLDADEVCGVGFEVSQKAHSALRWLFARQGDWKTGLVTWVLSKQGVDIVDPTAGTIEAGDNDIALPDDYDAGQGVALRFRTKLNGYRKSLGSTDDVILMGLDAATPGRLAITTYRELKASEYLDRLEAWHGEKESEGVVGFVWLQDFGYDKANKRWRRFFGAPSPKDVAEACYGTRLDEKLRRNTVERLLPCILDGVSIPTDLMLTAVHRAVNRVGLDAWEWRRVLGIACALYRKHSFDHEKRRYSMSLELDRKSRDYLYGRLLAVADKVERMALTNAEKGRETTAARYMQRFADHPVETWKSIELALVPYKMRLGSKAKAYFALFDEIGDLFETSDFLNPRALTGEFLLGYHCQSFWFGKHRSEKGQWVERESIQDDNEENSED